MKLNLAGHRAVITGGSQGLGFAIAEELLAEGVAVAICARHAEPLAAASDKLRESGGDVYARVADVTLPSEVKTFIASAAEEMGGIDILVNNAGRAHPGPFAQLKDEDWHSDLELKLFSMIRCSREVLPYMREHQGGRIINISAVYGRSPDPRFFATSVNRAACQAFTKTLAMELAADKILVNSVNIGFVVTAQWERIHQLRAPQLPVEDFLQQLVKDEVPLGRFGQPDEVSGLVAFLASDRASYITGASIDVAGGMGRYV
jgi:3-oxoacyl-[acyl-carrier protein] reductase